MNQSKKITDLKAELHAGNHLALKEFWNGIEAEGTPIIEEYDSEKCLVTMVYRTDEDVDNILTVIPFDDREPEEAKMENVEGTDLWYKTHCVPNDIRFVYMFSVDDPLDDDWPRLVKNSTHDKYNKKKTELIKKDNTFLSFVVTPKAEEHYWVKKRTKRESGIIDTHALHSELLDIERTVWVYTPPGYDVNNNPYGVLLLTDGRDYNGRLCTPTVLDNLIAENKIPPMVAVFVASTNKRGVELACDGTYKSFLMDEVMALVESKYHISKEPSENIIGGVSLGGLTASYIGLNHSDKFGKVLSQSGSYWYRPEGFEGQDWMAKEYLKSERLPLEFYMEVGTLEPKGSMQDTNGRMRDMLRDKGYTVHYSEFKGGHDYLSWGETLATGLLSLVGTEQK